MNFIVQVILMMAAILAIPLTYAWLSYLMSGSSGVSQIDCLRGSQKVDNIIGLIIICGGLGLLLWWCIFK